MRKICEKMIREQLQRIRNEHGMDSYLAMLAKFPQMGVENILLLMHLFPKATLVCGKGAWRNYRAEIKEGERAIPLFCPVIMPGENSQISYGMVGVFDISQVQSEEPLLMGSTAAANSLEHIWKEVYSYVVLDDVKEEHIRNKLAKSAVNEQENTIYLRKGLQEKVREVELLKLYVKMHIKDMETVIFREELCDYLMIVLKRYFGQFTEVSEKIRYSDVFACSDDELQYFLRKLSLLTMKCISELSGQELLSFNETALCNIFFEPEDVAEVTVNILDAAESTKLEVLQQELLSFSNKVSAMTREEYQKLRELRNKQQLFSFPLPSVF